MIKFLKVFIFNLLAGMAAILVILFLAYCIHLLFEFGINYPTTFLFFAGIILSTLIGAAIRAEF